MKLKKYTTEDRLLGMGFEKGSDVATFGNCSEYKFFKRYNNIVIRVDLESNEVSFKDMHCNYLALFEKLKDNGDIRDTDNPKHPLLNMSRIICDIVESEGWWY